MFGLNIEFKFYIGAYECVKFQGKILNDFATHYASSFIHIFYNIMCPTFGSFKEFTGKKGKWVIKCLLHNRLTARC